LPAPFAAIEFMFGRTESVGRAKILGLAAENVPNFLQIDISVAGKKDA